MNVLALNIISLYEYGVASAEKTGGSFSDLEER
jgi:hypothetical protein